MRTLVIIALLCSPALAGPPMFADFEVREFIPAHGGLWAAGVDQCYEAGTRDNAIWLGAGKEPADKPHASFPLDAKLVATAAQRSQLVASARSGDTAFAVGFDGTILASHDGGATWAAQKSGTRRDLHAVWMRSPTEAFAAGVHGVLLATKDGTHWNAIATKLDTDLASVWGIDDDVYALGIGTSLVSHDRGATWKAMKLFAHLAFGQSADLVYAAGWRGMLWFTTDHGETWTQMLRLREHRCLGGD